MSKIIWTEHVIFMNIYVYKYTHMPAITNNEKEAMNFKEIKERVDGRSKRGGKQGRNAVTVL